MNITYDTVVAGDSYSRTPNAPNSNKFMVVNLPTGLSYLNEDGTISGTPAQVGRFAISVLAKNDGGVGAAVLDLTVNAPAVPYITSTDDVIQETTIPFSYQITAVAAQPVTSYNVTGLPTGFTVNTSTGVISGTYTSGTNTPEIDVISRMSATNSIGTGYRDLYFRLLQRPVITSSLSPVTLTRGRSMTPYTITASKSPQTFGASPLPDGLSINPVTGVISGTPTIENIWFNSLPANTRVATQLTPRPEIGGCSDSAGNFYYATYGQLGDPLLCKMDSSGNSSVVSYLYMLYSEWVSSVDIHPITGDLYCSFATKIVKVTQSGVDSIFVTGLTPNIISITFDSTGLLYAADFGGGLRSIDSLGNITTLESSGFSAYICCDIYDNVWGTAADSFKRRNSVGAITTFSAPWFEETGVFLSRSPDGDMYFLINAVNQAYVPIWKITQGGVISEVWWGLYAARAASKNFVGNSLYVIADPTNSFVGQDVEKFIFTASTATSSTFAGSAGNSGSTNGTGSSARFNNPAGICGVPDASILYVADNQNNCIRKITSAGVVTTFAGSPGSPGDADGTGTSARFNYPIAITIDLNGNLYVLDEGAGVSLRKITPAGVVTTLVDSTETRIATAKKVCVIPDGTIFITTASTIIKVTSAGSVSIFAGSEISAGNYPFPGVSLAPYGIDSRTIPTDFILFDNLDGITSSPAGEFYIFDSGNGKIKNCYYNNGQWRIRPVAGWSAGEQAGASPGRFTVQDGAGLHPPFLPGPVNDSYNHWPFAAFTATSSDYTQKGGDLTCDTYGNLYLCETGSNTIRMINFDDPNGIPFVTTLVGIPGISGSSDGAGRACLLNAPRGIWVGLDGVLYVADTENHTIRKIYPQANPYNTPTTLSADNGKLIGTASKTFNVPV